VEKRNANKCLTRTAKGAEKVSTKKRTKLERKTNRVTRQQNYSKLKKQITPTMPPVSQTRREKKRETKSVSWTIYQTAQPPRTLVARKSWHPMSLWSKKEKKQERSWSLVYVRATWKIPVGKDIRWRLRMSARRKKKVAQERQSVFKQKESWESPTVVLKAIHGVLLERRQSWKTTQNMWQPRKEKTS
jgi:hypothetical protein